MTIDTDINGRLTEQQSEPYLYIGLLVDKDESHIAGNEVWQLRDLVSLLHQLCC